MRQLKGKSLQRVEGKTEKGNNHMMCHMLYHVSSYMFVHMENGNENGNRSE